MEQQTGKERRQAGGTNRGKKHALVELWRLAEGSTAKVE